MTDEPKQRKATRRRLYRVTDQLGNIHTRQTESKFYTHCVIVYGNRGREPYVATWCSRKELAEKEARLRGGRYGDGVRCVVAAVELVP